MNKLFETLLQDFLPTKLSRLIAAATMSLTGGVFCLPEGLALLQVQLTPPTILLIRCTVPLMIISLGLFCVLVLVVLHFRSSRLASKEFIDYKGANFKRKPSGGYHEVVYCGICKSPTSTRSQLAASYYQCKCGWVSSFTFEEFDTIFKELPP